MPLPIFAAFAAPAAAITTKTVLATLGASVLGTNFAESFVDNVFRDKVHPDIGSVLYVDMLFGRAEHSGIYVGNGEVVELRGDGLVCKVPASYFIDDGSLKMTGVSIYVSSQSGCAVGSELVAERALSMLGCRRNYNFIFDNCHQFCSGCLTGNFENSDNFLWMLKHTAQKTIGADEWRVWDR